MIHLFEATGYEPDDVADAVTAIKEEPEFRALLKLAKYISSQRLEAGGTLVFELPIEIPKSGRLKKKYSAYANGYLRTNGGHMSIEKWGIVEKPDPQLPKDLLERYRELLKRLEPIIQKRHKEQADIDPELGFRYELEKDTDPGHAKTVLKLFKQLFEFDQKKPGKVTVHADLSLSTPSVHMRDRKSVDELPIKFRSVPSLSITGVKKLSNLPASLKTLTVTDGQLDNLDGSPAAVDHFEVMNSGKALSLKGSPTSVNNYQIFDAKVESLDGAPRRMLQAYLPYSPTLPLLKLAMIDGLQSVNFGSRSASQKLAGKIDKIEEIVEKHLGKGREGVLNLQQDLMDHGFDGNAKW